MSEAIVTPTNATPDPRQQMVNDFLMDALQSGKLMVAPFGSTFDLDVALCESSRYPGRDCIMVMLALPADSDPAQVPYPVNGDDE